MSRLIAGLAEGLPPMGRDELLELVPEKDYSDGRTKQSFKDETNINRLLARAQKAGALSHLEKYEPVYGDFADFDFFEAQRMIVRGREAFDELPAEVRKEFHNSPQAFYEFVNDPANKDDLAKKLPALAAPGRQNIDVSGRSEPVETVEKHTPTGASEPQASETTTNEASESG